MISGFIYLWHDRTRRMHYLGSHIGPENDGYIGSSVILRRAISERPKDFRRRIIERIYADNHRLVRLVEQRWLQMIKPEELGVRYYNLKRRAFGGDVYNDLSLEQQILIKLTATKGKNHPKARAVIINDVRYVTARLAHKVLGFSPRKRLSSKRLKDREWYYEDEGKLSVEECEKADAEHKRIRAEFHLRLAKVLSEKPKEWHRRRIEKGLPKRRGKHWKLSEKAKQNIGKGHIGLRPNLKTIEKMREARRQYWIRRKAA